MTEASDSLLGRAERRFLRRIFNGRSVPITADGHPFRTYKEASRYLLSLPPEARERAYSQMKRAAAEGNGSL
jgi:hypothetical protein